VFIFVVGLVTFLMLIELGFRRGERGPNKYARTRWQKPDCAARAALAHEGA
jgi:uncharacterized membrane protein YhaH (DUF805 family)